MSEFRESVTYSALLTDRHPEEREREGSAFDHLVRSPRKTDPSPPAQDDSVLKMRGRRRERDLRADLKRQHLPRRLVIGVDASRL